MLIILILEIMIVEGYYYCISFTDLILVYYHYVHQDANDNSGKRWEKFNTGSCFVLFSLLFLAQSLQDRCCQVGIKDQCI